MSGARSRILLWKDDSQCAVKYRGWQCACMASSVDNSGLFAIAWALSGYSLCCRLHWWQAQMSAGWPCAQEQPWAK